MLVLYPQEILEEVRVQNDIVDVISEYLPLKQKEHLILVFVHSTMKNTFFFLSVVKDNFIIVLAVVQQEMYILLLCRWKMTLFQKQ